MCLYLSARARVCVCVPVRVCVREATTTITTKNNNNNKSCPITSDANLGSNLSNQPPTIQPTVLPWRKQTHASVRILISQLTHGIHHTDTLTKADIFLILCVLLLLPPRLISFSCKAANNSMLTVLIIMNAQLRPRAKWHADVLLAVAFIGGHALTPAHIL